MYTLFPSRKPPKALSLTSLSNGLCRCLAIMAHIPQAPSSSWINRITPSWPTVLRFLEATGNAGPPSARRVRGGFWKPMKGMQANCGQDEPNNSTQHPHLHCSQAPVLPYESRRISFELSKRLHVVASLCLSLGRRYNVR